MPKFESTKRNLPEGMIFCFQLKNSAAGCHRLFVEAYGNHTPTVRLLKIGFDDSKVEISTSRTKSALGSQKI